MEFNELTPNELLEINGGGWDMDEGTVAQATATIALICTTAQAIYDSGRGLVDGIQSGYQRASQSSLRTSSKRLRTRY